MGKHSRVGGAFVSLRCVQYNYFEYYYTKIGMKYIASDISLRSLHTTLVSSSLTSFRIADRREKSVNTLNGTSVVECSIVKLSSTNVKLDTVQTSSYIGIGEKLETLITHRRVVCAMYSGV